MEKKQPFGFTLLELVVVATLMALLTTVILATAHNARMKTRDTRRVAIVTQLQSALVTYYRDTGSYPLTSNVVPGQALASNDIVYLKEVPHNPQPWTDGDCADENFSYSQDNGGISYHFNFCLGLGSGDLPVGDNIMTPVGFY
ncbi:MAG: prepilin-type N-terminal cleavage/methylation domain-containing protein [bacterium]